MPSGSPQLQKSEDSWTDGSPSFRSFHVTDSSRSLGVKKESFVLDKGKMQKELLKRSRKQVFKKSSTAPSSKRSISDDESSMGTSLQMLQETGGNLNNTGAQQEPPKEQSTVSSVQAEVTLRDVLLCIVDGSTNEMPSQKIAYASTVFTIIVISTILLSVACFCAETVPAFQNSKSKQEFFDWVEYYCVALFTFEYVSRFALTYDKLAFLKDFFNTIDVLAILPFYIRLILSLAGVSSSVSLVFFRALRLVRILRVIRIGQYSRTVWIVFYALSASVQSVTLLFVLFFVATILFSSLLFIAEQTGSYYDEKREVWVRNDGVDSPFPSIPHCFWFVMVTLSTCGYGDQVPYTVAGKLVTSLCILTGTLLLSCPVIMISQNFRTTMEVFEEVEDELLTTLSESEDPVVVVVNPLEAKVGKKAVESKDNTGDNLGSPITLGTPVTPGSDIRSFESELSRGYVRTSPWYYSHEYRDLFIYNIVAMYNPLLVVGGLETHEFAEWKDMYPRYVVMFTLTMDSDDARYEASMCCNMAFDFHSVSCFPVYHLSLKVPDLPQQCHLLYTSYKRPNDDVKVVIASPTPSLQETLLATLPSFDLCIDCVINTIPTDSQEVLSYSKRVSLHTLFPESPVHAVISRDGGRKISFDRSKLEGPRGELRTRFKIDDN